MLKQTGVVFPTLFAIFLVISTPADADSHVTLSDFLTAVDKLVGYYAANYHVMNLDGIFGLRVIEGHIFLMLKEYTKQPNMATFPAWANTQLQSTYAKAKHAADSSIKYLKKNSLEYYETLKFLVDKPFMVTSAYRRIDPSLIWTSLEKKTLSGNGNFTEEFSDSCMALLMGTGNPPQPKCTLSNDCMEMMFFKGMADYSITHQLLFTMLAEQEGCLPQLDAAVLSRGIPGGVAHMRLEFCTNNFFEVANTLKGLGGTVLPRYQDLFMEQEYVCPSLGFMEFLHSDWLAEIIKWQRPSGCYGAMKRKTTFVGVATGDNEDYEYMGESVKHDVGKHNEVFKRNDNIDTDNAVKGNSAQMIPKKEHAGGAPILMDRNVDAARSRIEIRPELDRNQMGDVHNAEIKHPVNEAGPIGQHGLLNRPGTGQHNQMHIEEHAGSHGQQEIRAERRQIGNRQNLDEKRSAIEAAPVGQQPVEDKLRTGPQKLLYQEQRGGNPKQEEIGAKLDRSQIRNVQRLGQSRPVNEAGRMGQRGVYNKYDTGRQNQDGLPPGHKEIRSELDHDQIGSRPHLTQKHPAIDNAPPTQQGMQDKLGKWRLKQWFQEQHGGEMHHVPLHNVPALPQKSVVYRSRKLLFEETLPDGCLAHKTAVAAGALSQYLRYMLMPGSANYQRYTHLTGVNYLLNPHNLRTQNMQQELETQYQAAVPKRDDARSRKDKAEIDPRKDYEAEKRMPKKDASLNRDEGDAQKVPGDGHGKPRDVYKEPVNDRRAPGDGHGRPDDDRVDLPQKNDIVDIDAKPNDNHYVNDANIDKESNDREIQVGDADRYADANVIAQVHSPSSVSAMSLLKAYVLIIALMFVVIVMMCKFLRRHRVLIRYRHR